MIDKPADITSHDVVSRVRHILAERRVGHTGTLDPFATGVLVVLVGRATRLAQFLTGLEKEYDAIIRLGYATDTGDHTGRAILPGIERSASGVAWTPDQIHEAMASFLGEIDQVPPMFSAKKQHGKKLYELARQGEIVQRQPIKVSIHEFRAVEPGSGVIKDNLDGTFDVAAKVVCSAGTYVRALAEDLGKRLGIGAHLAELRRTRVGIFEISNAISLDELKVRFSDGALGTILIPPAAALSQLPLVHLTGNDELKARHGVEVKVEGANWVDGMNVRMCDEHGELIAVGDYNAEQQRLHPRVVLASAD